MKNPWMKLVLLACALPCLAPAAVKLSVQDARVTIQNGAAALDFDLKGGRCTSLVTEPAGRSWVAAAFGGFELHIAGQYAEGPSDYGQAKYFAKVLKDTPEAATFELSAFGKQESYGFCEARKRVTLTADSPCVRVVHEFFVGEGAVVDQYPSFLFVQSAPADARITVPAEDQGFVTVTAASPTAKLKPALGWVAVQKGDAGVVYRMPMEDIQYVGVRNAEGGIKLVWRTIAQKIEPGRSLTWPVEVMPFQGLPEVNGAGALGCGRIDPNGGVTFFATAAGAADIEVATRTAANSDWAALPARKADLKRGLNTLPISLPSAFAGQVRVRLVSGGRDAVLYRNIGSTLPLPLQTPRLAEAQAPLHVRDVDYNDYLETPHVAWAKPLEGDALRIFCSWGELAANRMVNEIMERVDARVDTVTMASGEGIGWGLGGLLYGARVQRDIDEGMKGYLGGDRPYDVIVLGGLSFPNHIGDAIGLRILERVRNGAGLVFGGISGMPKSFAEAIPVKRAFGNGQEKWSLKPAGYHPLTAGLPIDQMAAGITKYIGVRPEAQVLAIAGTDGTGTNATENPAIVTATLGKGRIVVLGGLPDGEEGQALMAKAILWAAGREPALRITALKTDKAAYPYGVLPKVTLQCAAEAGGAFDVVLACEGWAKTNRMTVAGGTGLLEVALPVPPVVGNHRVDVLISRNGRRANFGFVAFVVDSVQAGLAIHLDAANDAAWGCPVYKYDGVIAGQVKPAAGYESVAELVDIHGRVLDRKTPDAQGHFSLAATRTDRPRATVRVRLLRAGLLAQETSAPVAIGMIPGSLAWDEMQVLLYGNANNDPRGHVILDACDPWGGGDLLRPYVWVGVPCGIAEIDTGAWDSLQREYGKTKDIHLLSRVPCINSSSYASLVQEICRKRASSVGTLAYLNGDEQSFTSYTREFDFCFSPDCLREFRRYLADKYGAIAKLNAIWQTQYTGFDAIVPPLTADARKDAKLLPAWNDFRLFNNLTFAKGYRMIRDELRKYDPMVRLGISGTQGPAAFGGYDYTLLMPVFDMLMEYPGWEDLQIAINPRVKFAPAVGYSGDYPNLKCRVWNMLALGGAGVSYYDAGSGIYPTLRMASGFKGMVDAIAQMRPTGISKMIMTAERACDPVAVYYSHESINAGCMGLGGDVAAGQRWLAALHAGTTFQGTYLTRGKLLAGATGLRVVALPRISSLSDAEIEALRGFMDNGGFVLGDDTLGVVDQYLRRRTDTAALAALQRHANYAPLEQVSESAALSRFLRERAKLTPASDVSREDGGAPGVRIATFRNGALTYLVTGANSGAQPLHLTLAGGTDKSWVYDSRTGVLLGQGKVQFDVPPAESAVLARLPYRVSGIDLRVPATAAKGAELAISAAVKADGAPGAHVLAFTIIDPAGETTITSRWRVTAKAGSVDTTFFVPFNARSGAWRIEARDAATGVRNTASFMVE